MISDQSEIDGQHKNYNLFCASYYMSVLEKTYKYRSPQNVTYCCHYQEQKVIRKPYLTGG